MWDFQKSFLKQLQRLRRPHPAQERRLQERCDGSVLSKCETILRVASAWTKENGEATVDFLMWVVVLRGWFASAFCCWLWGPCTFTEELNMGTVLYICNSWNSLHFICSVARIASWKYSRRDGTCWFSIQIFQAFTWYLVWNERFCQRVLCLWWW